MTYLQLRQWEGRHRSLFKKGNLPYFKLNSLKNAGFNFSSQIQKYRPFEKAKEFVKRLNLKNGREWKEYCRSGKKPNDIPITPDEVYDEWISIYEWLGIYKRGDWLTFEKSREFVHQLGIKNIKEWKTYCKSGKCPSNIPFAPQFIYREWISFGDWFGTNRIGTRYVSYITFEDAKKRIQQLKLKTTNEFRNLVKSNIDIRNKVSIIPHIIYKNKGWLSYGDFLGTNNLSPKDIRDKCSSYEESQKFISSLGLRTRKDWDNYKKSGKRPSNIPSNPWSAYKNKGWISIKDWIGAN